MVLTLTLIQIVKNSGRGSCASWALLGGLHTKNNKIRKDETNHFSNAKGNWQFKKTVQYFPHRSPSTPILPWSWEMTRADMPSLSQQGASRKPHAALARARAEYHYIHAWREKEEPAAHQHWGEPQNSHLVSYPRGRQHSESHLSTFIPGVISPRWGTFMLSTGRETEHQMITEASLEQSHLSSFPSDALCKLVPRESYLARKIAQWAEVWSGGWRPRFHLQKWSQSQSLE